MRIVQGGGDLHTFHVNYKSANSLAKSVLDVPT